MAEYHNPNEFRLSSSAFQWGDITFTDYKSGCLRKILLQSRDIQAHFNSSKNQGGRNEDRHQARLVTSKTKFLRETEFKGEIKGSSVSFSGHADFILVDDGINPTCVDELKSVTSKNVRRSVIKNGEYSTENLAQLVAYMGAARVTRGRLIYTFYEQDSNNSQWYATDERIFLVTLDDFGKISVDSKPTQFSYNDMLAHRMASAKVIETGNVAPRPYRWEVQFVSPCRMCDFKEACDKFDKGEIESNDAFVEFAKNLVARSA